MVPYAHLQFIKIVEKVVDARRDDDGVLEVRLGITTKQMRPYTRFLSYSFTPKSSSP